MEEDDPLLVGHDQKLTAPQMNLDHLDAPAATAKGTAAKPSLSVPANVAVAAAAT